MAAEILILSDVDSSKEKTKWKMTKQASPTIREAASNEKNVFMISTIISPVKLQNFSS
jgi:hypothetical protein